VGGDLYVPALADGRWQLCVGDVSGKGIAAALLNRVSPVRAHARSNSARRTSCRGWIGTLQSTQPDYLTFFIAELDAGSTASAT
jgi:hypothetical protein